MIKCAAIETKDAIYSLEKSNRHHNIIKFILDQCGCCDQNSIQGFITSQGKFVDRIEAMKIAKKHKQVKNYYKFNKIVF